MTLAPIDRIYLTQADWDRLEGQQAEEAKLEGGASLSHAIWWDKAMPPEVAEWVTANPPTVVRVHQPAAPAGARAGAWIPDGWQLVPIKPTRDMVDAGNKKTWVLPARDCWAAMLAAAPAAVPTPLPEHADHVAEIAIRLRRVGRIAGVEQWIPDDDALAVGAIFTVLGTMANAMECELKAAQARAAAPSEERRQLQHLLDDIVEEADQDGCSYYRVRDGKDVLFSNMVGACARLLAKVEIPCAVTGDAS